ncbi:helix-turn-helix domain-containing protein [Bacillus thuringiensis]|uniref:helix-turn-helix domain-containing protein n=1 Tax=Bacillus thuringiensis TaxID=1428 RepID=UPI0029602B4C|nr:helix-turn-helix transcriptional regulator [Bacillus cereus]HEF1867011.1 helix-turn-helix transcriptional regulator [Bacillus cereus]HEF1876692.1 helix-turn-helix transcriptional regulator [Bacillus cereus]HEF1882727.1 helix-turn-helix transcriptional regulator [Bacillus cereus]
MDIGGNLKFLRKRYGWTTEHVANQLEVSISTYNGYEINYRKPNPEMLCKLADVFNSTTDFILGRTDNPNGSKDSLQDILENGTLNYGGRELTIEETEKVRDFFNIAIKRMLS